MAIRPRKVAGVVVEEQGGRSSLRARREGPGRIFGLAFENGIYLGTTGKKRIGGETTVEASIPFRETLTLLFLAVFDLAPVELETGLSRPKTILTNCGRTRAFAVMDLWEYNASKARSWGCLQ